ncbi:MULTISPECIES: hypothetical protein [Desulfitobacterium]|uniref:hypothetical protein n=1 Tax=Desulfitobacterium TaxID=36853 RepID=UPI0011AACD53|nr:MULTISPECIES: hypothetical protein [Desulfitobacterium]MEA5026016.1 hypothetical protein [Desulfitobacterium hafniense]
MKEYKGKTGSTARTMRTLFISAVRPCGQKCQYWVIGYDGFLNQLEQQVPHRRPGSTPSKQAFRVGLCCTKDSPLWPPVCPRVALGGGGGTVTPAGRAMHNVRAL